MKKILHKLRVWLIRKLGGVRLEAYEVEVDSYYEEVKENAKLRKAVSDRDRDLEIRRRQIKALKIVIREICRRSETSYYDWCCDYCQSPVRCKHNGWCQLFIPRGAGEDGGTNE